MKGVGVFPNSFTREAAPERDDEPSCFGVWLLFAKRTYPLKALARPMRLNSTSQVFYSIPEVLG